MPNLSHELIRKLQHLRLPELYWECSVKELPKEPHSEIIRDWAANIEERLFDGDGLYLYGDFGSGKTGSAAILLKTAAAFNLFGLYIVFEDIQEYTINEDKNLFNSTTGKTIWERAGEVPLLVVDEFQPQQNKKWHIEKLERLVRERYGDKKSTIITSNIPYNRLESHEKYKALTKGFHSFLKENTEAVKVQGDFR